MTKLSNLYCTTCEKVFSSKQRRDSHIKKIHADEVAPYTLSEEELRKRFKSDNVYISRRCDTCERMFSSKRYRDIHIQNKHSLKLNGNDNTEKGKDVKFGKIEKSAAPNDSNRKKRETNELPTSWENMSNIVDRFVTVIYRF